MEGVVLPLVLGRMPRDSLASLPAVSERFIALALAAESLLGEGSVIDFLVGEPVADPPVLDAPQLSDALRQLAQDAFVFARDLETGDFSALWIAESTRALAAFVEARSGLFLGSYEDAVTAILGAPPVRRSQEELAGLRQRLLTALADAGYGEGWPDAVWRWQEDASINADDYLCELESHAARLRELAHEYVLIPVLGEGEAAAVKDMAHVKCRLVDTDATWAAFHIYEGDFSSEIQINRKRIFNRDEAAIFASHEIYPGHHTHATIREQLFRSGKVGVEGSIALLHTPASVIDEGLGEYARNFLTVDYSPRERAAYLHDRLISDTRNGLALDLNAGRIGEEEAVAGLRDGAAISADRARSALDFAQDWKYYFPAYTLGFDVVGRIYTEFGARSLRPLYSRKTTASIEEALLSP